MPYPVAAVRNKINNNSAFVGLLDTVPGALAAYSFARKLRLAYSGSLIRLRRSSDNAESDFGANALGDLDTASITTWLSGANGFITTVYDQSGNGYDLTQATAGAQPSYDATGAGGKPTASFVGASLTMLLRPTFTILDGMSAAIVVKSGNSLSKYVFDLGDGTHSFIQGYVATKWEWYASPRTQIGTISTSAFQTISFNNCSTRNSPVGLGGYATGPNDWWTGLMPEAIAWTSALTAGQHTTIASNQAAYYGY
jgi:hypothetical protein